MDDLTYRSRAICAVSRHRHSIFCILPPYMLRSIAENGNSEEASTALRTLATDATFRLLRSTNQAVSSVPPLQSAVFTTRGQKHRTIFDAQNLQTLPGQVARLEGSTTSGDSAVDEAYDGLGHTFDFLSEVFERNSIDDNGMPLNGIVHFDENYGNAFWDGQQMVFGDGDGTLFNRFTIALDIIAHELGHGVTQDEAHLLYTGETGALNESISDAIGSLVKQYILRQTAEEADWLIGSGLLAPGRKGVALRSMKEPGTAYDDPVLGKDPQPSHMQDFFQTWQDNGGVHINSGIPNRAFCLAALNIGGYAWESVGQIWYDTVRNKKLSYKATFRSFARLTVRNAGQRFGDGSLVQKAIRDAWKQVGITVR